MSIFPFGLRWQSQLQNIIDQAPKAHSAARARELMDRLDSFEPDDYAVEPQVEILKDEVAG